MIQQTEKQERGSTVTEGRARLNSDWKRMLQVNYNTEKAEKEGGATSALDLEQETDQEDLFLSLLLSGIPLEGGLLLLLK